MFLIYVYNNVKIVIYYYFFVSRHVIERVKMLLQAHQRRHTWGLNEYIERESVLISRDIDSRGKKKNTCVCVCVAARALWCVISIQFTRRLMVRPRWNNITQMSRSLSSRSLST